MKIGYSYLRQPMAWMSHRSDFQAAIFIIIAASLILVRKLGQDWNGIDGGDGAMFSTIARNYLRYGVWDLRFGQAVNVDQVEKIADLGFYQHHPPLLTLLIAAAFYIFGECESAARLIPVLSTIGSMILMFAINRRIFGSSLAVLAVFVFCTFPGILYFGRKPGFEPLTLFFILLTTWSYICTINRHNNANIFGLFISVLFGLISDWPFYFLCLILTIHYWFTQNSLKLRIGICTGLLLTPPSVFLLLQMQSYLVDKDSFMDLIRQGMTYAGLISSESALAEQYPEASIVFSPMEFINRVCKFLNELFAYPTITLSLFGAFSLTRLSGSERFLALTLLLVPIMYNTLFFHNVFIFQPCLFYFAPSFAILAAIGIGSLIETERGLSGERQIMNMTLDQPKLLFIVCLVLVGTWPRLLTFHHEQIKLLPGKNLEPSTFISELGKQIKINSTNGETILTNLKNTGHVLPYYAERNIIGYIGPLNEIENRLSSFDNKPVAILVWETPAESCPCTTIRENLFSKGTFKEISVQGHHFTWVEFKNDRDLVFD